MQRLPRGSELLKSLTHAELYFMLRNNICTTYCHSNNTSKNMSKTDFEQPLLSVQISGIIVVVEESACSVYELLFSPSL